MSESRINLKINAVGLPDGTVSPLAEDNMSDATGGKRLGLKSSKSTAVNRRPVTAKSNTAKRLHQQNAIEEVQQTGLQQSITNLNQLIDHNRNKEGSSFS